MSRQSSQYPWIAGLALGLLASVLTACGGQTVAQDTSGSAARGQALFMEKGCYGCHTLGKMGTPIGPDLTRNRTKYRESDLARLLINPSAQEPRHMPVLGLSEAEARALAAYLSSPP